MGVGKLSVYQQNFAMRPGNVPGAGAGNGSSIDRLDYFSAVINLSAATITSGSIVGTIQTSRDQSTWTDLQIDGTTITTETLTATNSTTDRIISLTNADRYIRVVTATTGTVSAFSVTFLLFDKKSGDDWEDASQYTQPGPTA